MLCCAFILCKTINLSFASATLIMVKKALKNVKNALGAKKDIALLALLLFAGLAIAVLFYSGPFYSYDDMNYINFAFQAMHGSFYIGESPYAYGFAFPYFIAVSFWLLGYGALQGTFPSIFSYLAMIAVTYMAARSFKGTFVAALAAMLTLTAPFLIQYSTRVMPDLVLGLFAGLSVLLALLAGSSRHEKTLYALSGVLAGFTVFIKLEALAFALFFFIGILFLSLDKQGVKHRSIDKDAIIAGIALLAVLYAYFVCVYAMTGSAFYTIERYGAFQHSISPVTFNDNVENLIITLSAFNTNGIFRPYALSPIIYPYGLGLVFAMMASGIGIMERNRKITFLSIVAWGFFLYMYFGTMSLSHYIFIAVITRYFSMIAVPVSILGALGIASFYDMIKEYCKNCAIVAAMLIIALVVLVGIPTYLTIYSYNKAIALDNSAIKCATGYLQGNGIAQTYTNAAPGIIGLYSAYKMHAYIIGNRCNSTYFNSTLLFFYGNESALKGLDGWLGSRCGAEQAYRCNESINGNTYNSTIHDVNILRIYPK